MYTYKYVILYMVYIIFVHNVSCGFGKENLTSHWSSLPGGGCIW